MSYKVDRQRGLVRVLYVSDNLRSRQGIFSKTMRPYNNRLKIKEILYRKYKNKNDVISNSLRHLFPLIPVQKPFSVFKYIYIYMIYYSFSEH